MNNIEDIISDLKKGQMVILVDDEDRENEGDLLIAADHITPEFINFMAKYGRGLICLTLTEDKANKLKLPLMVEDNQGKLGTNFTVSIDASSGITTGISAGDRLKQSYPPFSLNRIIHLLIGPVIYFRSSHIPVVFYTERVIQRPVAILLPLRERVQHLLFVKY